MAIDIEVAETIQLTFSEKGKTFNFILFELCSSSRVNPKNQKKRKGLDLGNSVIYS